MSYFKAGNLIEQLTTTATAGGTTTLTITSTSYQQFTGTLNQTVVMPAGTTLNKGQKVVIQNRSTGVITVNANGGGLLAYVQMGAEREFRLENNSSSAGTWDISAGIYGTEDSPCRLYASSTADAYLHIAPSQIIRPNGAAQSVGAISQVTPVFVESTINFATQATTGGTFSITFPASTVGKFRRLAFTLLSTGTMAGVFSSEQTTVAALADPGTLYNPAGTPIGWIDLQCTVASPSQFKTANSATAIIENQVSGTATISNLGGGAGGGGGGGYIVTANQTVAASATITNSTGNARQLLYVSGSAAGQNVISNTPFGSAGGWQDGTEILLIGTSNSNTVVLTFNDASYGAVGNLTTLELGLYDTARFIYSASLLRWILA